MRKKRLRRVLCLLLVSTLLTSGTLRADNVRVGNTPTFKLGDTISFSMADILAAGSSTYAEYNKNAKKDREAVSNFNSEQMSNVDAADKKWLDLINRATNGEGERKFTKKELESIGGKGFFDEVAGNYDPADNITLKAAQAAKDFADLYDLLNNNTNENWWDFSGFDFSDLTDLDIDISGLEALLSQMQEISQSSDNSENRDNTDVAIPDELLSKIAQMLLYGYPAMNSNEGQAYRTADGKTARFGFSTIAEEELEKDLSHGGIQYFRVNILYPELSSSAGFEQDKYRVTNAELSKILGKNPLNMTKDIETLTRCSAREFGQNGSVSLPVLKCHTCGLYYSIESACLCGKTISWNPENYYNSDGSFARHNSSSGTWETGTELQHDGATVSFDEIMKDETWGKLIKENNINKSDLRKYMLKNAGIYNPYSVIDNYIENGKNSESPDMFIVVTNKPETKDSIKEALAKIIADNLNTISPENRPNIKDAAAQLPGMLDSLMDAFSSLDTSFLDTLANGDPKSQNYKNAVDKLADGLGDTGIVFGGGNKAPVTRPTLLLRKDIKGANKLDKTFFANLPADMSFWTRDQLILYAALYAMMNRDGFDKMMSLLQKQGYISIDGGLLVDPDDIARYAEQLIKETAIGEEVNISWTETFEEDNSKTVTKEQDLNVLFQYTIVDSNKSIVTQFTGNGGTEFYTCNREGEFTIIRAAAVYKYQSVIKTGIKTVKFYNASTDPPTLLHSVEYTYQVENIQGVDTPGQTKWTTSNIPVLKFNVKGGALQLSISNDGLGTQRLW